MYVHRCHTTNIGSELKEDFNKEGHLGAVHTAHFGDIGGTTKRPRNTTLEPVLPCVISTTIVETVLKPG